MHVLLPLVLGGLTGLFMLITAIVAFVLNRRARTAQTRLAHAQAGEAGSQLNLNEIESWDYIDKAVERRAARFQTQFDSQEAAHKSAIADLVLAQQRQVEDLTRAYEARLDSMRAAYDLAIDGLKRQLTEAERRYKAEIEALTGEIGWLRSLLDRMAATSSEVRTLLARTPQEHGLHG